MSLKHQPWLERFFFQKLKLVMKTYYLPCMETNHWTPCLMISLSYSFHRWKYQYFTYSFIYWHWSTACGILSGRFLLFLSKKLSSGRANTRIRHDGFSQLAQQPRCVKRDKFMSGTNVFLRSCILLIFFTPKSGVKWTELCFQNEQNIRNYKSSFILAHFYKRR